ncbi:MAG: iron-sulfur cluster assembly scaffold protein [Alphaproteobacteria bacterium]|nr:iron-sulfur cluster assembly scaffold protein [Alphaproteobacteria bacterium]
MSDDLYPEAILRLAQSARGAGRLDPPGLSATTDSPICGDRATVEVRAEGGKVRALAHAVRGCVLCRAAAAALAEVAEGTATAEIAALPGRIAAMLKGESQAPSGRFAAFAVFAPVGPHRSRHGCVLLPLRAAAQALDKA